MMHRYPIDDHLPLSVSTEHTANIFGVQFLPHTGDRMLISGAMDSTVQLHELESMPTHQFRYPWDVGDDGTVEAVEVTPRTTVFHCHRERVKDVEVDEDSPSLFWSASEDGTIRQFDIRCRYTHPVQASCNNVLVGVRSSNGGDAVDLKGLDINKARPHLMAVACGDPYIRIFDRRQLSLGSMETTFPEPVLKLAPPHLSLVGIDTIHCSATYVNFSNRGDKVLTQLHGDHAYTFDVTSDGVAACTFIRPGTPIPNGCSWYHLGQDSKDWPNAFPSPHCMTTEAEKHQTLSTRCASVFDQTKGIRHLSDALRCDPMSPVLYVDRARCLLKRKAPGDAMAALRDCDQASALNPRFEMPHVIRIQALARLNQPLTARQLMRKFMKEFPNEKSSGELKQAYKTIQEQLPRDKRPAAKRMRQVTNGSMESVDGWMQNGFSVRQGSDGHRERSGSPETSSGGSSEEIVLDDEEEDENHEAISQHYLKDKQMEDDGRPRGYWWSTQGGRRLLTCFAGQMNFQTDIKECTFLGSNDAFVACGSDDGRVFIYNTETGHPVNMLKADESVCNCVQCHPTDACLATSGIESVVRLWSPMGDVVDQKLLDDRVVANVHSIARGPRMQSISTQQMLMRVRMILDNYDLGMAVDDGDDPSSDDEGPDRAINCRMH